MRRSAHEETLSCGSAVESFSYARMLSPVLDELKVEAVFNSFVLEDDIRQDVKEKLQLFLEKLTGSARLVENAIE